jgi:hypothetical protein
MRRYFKPQTKVDASVTLQSLALPSPSSSDHADGSLSNDDDGDDLSSDDDAIYDSDSSDEPTVASTSTASTCINTDNGFKAAWAEEFNEWLNVHYDSAVAVCKYCSAAAMPSDIKHTNARYKFKHGYPLAQLTTRGQLAQHADLAYHIKNRGAFKSGERDHANNEESSIYYV